MSELTELLTAGDADLHAEMGERVGYLRRGAGSSSMVELDAVLSPLPESYEMTELGGAIVVSTVAATISKGVLADAPAIGDSIVTAAGRKYIVQSEQTASWDTSWHVTLRLANA